MCVWEKPKKPRSGLPYSAETAIPAGPKNGYHPHPLRLSLPGRSPVNFYHPHNIVRKERAIADRKFGIRVRLPKGDTFARVLGDDWETLHWYRTEQERDEAFADMARRHGYYRNTDTPTQVLEKLVR